MQGIIVRFFAAFILLSGISPPSMSQRKAGRPAMEAGDHIRALESGILVIRIPSEHRKIAAMDSILANPGLSTSQKKRIEAQLQSTREAKAQRIEAYSTAFKKWYDFSRYVFVFDYDMPALWEGHATLYDREFQEGAVLPPDIPVYILSTGRNPDSQLEALTILDDQLRTLPRPFPGSVIRSGWQAILSWFSGESIERQVRKLNEKLHKYAERAASAK